MIGAGFMNLRPLKFSQGTGSAAMTVKQAHFCYILSVVGDDQTTYVGYTVNIERRLRQHNGEIGGGARFTHRHGPRRGKQWRVIALLTSPDLNLHRGLSLEWHIKHPDGRRRKKHVVNRCVAARVCGMVRAMVHHKFTGDQFTSWIVPEYKVVLMQAMTDASHMDRCEVNAWPSEPVLPPCDSTGHESAESMDCDSS